MHGTYLNEEPLDTEVARPLAAGDEVTFGSSVYRNQKTFKPATVTVGVEFQTQSVLATFNKVIAALTLPCSGQADHSPSRVFTVPDDCSTDENEPLDDIAPQKIPTYISEQEINPWQEEMNEQHNVVPQIDGIIEIDSSSESDSDALPHDCISIMSDDGDNDAMDTGDLAAEFDDDDESISLTDDEDASSAPASPVESIDLDDLDLADNNGARSPSWNSVSTDSHSEHMAEHPRSGHNSEEEQGVFLYESESEEMDDIDPINDDLDRYSQPVCLQSQYPPAQTTLATQAVPSGQPVLPSLNTALSQPDFTRFAYQLAPVMQPAPREPSPSDAVLPVGRRHHGSEDDCGVTVETLGLKSGKPDFFEAREQNKIKMAHDALHAANASHFAQMAMESARIDKNVLRPGTEAIPQCPTSSSTEIQHPSAFTLNEEAHPEPTPQHEAQMAPVPQPFTAFSGRMTSQGNRGLLRNPYDLLPVTLEETLSTAPLKETSEMDTTAQEVVDPAWTAASADELFQMKQLAQIRTNRPSGYFLNPPPVAPVASEQSEARKDTTKGKRKAADISETTDEERVWQQQVASDQEPVPSSPVPVQPEIEMDLSRLSFHNTPEQGSTAVRPTKMRKIAERVGYAALGGATVGAMVLTSLIYTAPNFA